MANIRRKESIDDLAIYGGKPLFDFPVHVGQPNIGNVDTFKQYVDDIFESRWLSNNGPFVQKFEKNIEQRLKVKNCIAMCNGTVALELAIRGLGLGGEVIVPSFTFIATAHSLLAEGVTPVFCDIEPNTHTIDPVSIEKAITDKTTAIMGVHLWGQLCDHDAISKIAEKHGLKIIYDAAHAFLCSRNGLMVGNSGDAEVLSFHATKFCNTFEGGAVITNNDELAEKLRLMRNFGFSGRDNVIHHGTNGKMSEICGAMGLVSLDSVDRFIEINHKNYQRYCDNLDDISGIGHVFFDTSDSNNYQYIVLEIDRDKFGLDRDALLNILTRENILARRYFHPGCHNMEPYRTITPTDDDTLPVTRDVCKKVLVLPTGSAISEADIDIICSLISFVSANTAEISKRQ